MRCQWLKVAGLGWGRAVGGEDCWAGREAGRRRQPPLYHSDNKSDNDNNDNDYNDNKSDDNKDENDNGAIPPEEGRESFQEKQACVFSLLGEGGLSSESRS